MLSSLLGVKFFQTFRIPVEEVDQVRFLAEKKMGFNHYKYISDAKMIDISLSGLGLSTAQELPFGQELRFSIQFKKMVVEVEGKVVRALGGGEMENQIIYGVALEEEGHEMKRFLKKYIFSFGPERLRDCLMTLSLTDCYSRSSEEIELFTLVMAIFKDLGKFASRKEFFPLILQEAKGVLDAEQASVFLIHPESNELRAIAALGVPSEDLQFNYREGIAGSVFTTGVPLNIDTVCDQIRPLFKAPPSKSVKSVICYPVHNSYDKVVGVIEVVNKRREKRFSTEDEEVMSIFSLVLGVIFRAYNPFSAHSQVRGFSTPFDREYAIIGKTPIVKKLRQSIGTLKNIKIPVLIQGERGVGKSLFAKIIHFEGKNKESGPEIVDALYSSEQEVAEKLLSPEGLFFKTQGGTVIIRNGHALSLSLQSQLARLFTEGSFLGRSLSCHVRLFITASEDLEKKVAEGTFHPKLFEYFSQAFVEIPPLRERKEDMADLINYFLKLECRRQGFLLKAFSQSLIQTFCEYDWPENVRELKAHVVRSVTSNPENHVISELDALSMSKIKCGLLGPKLFDDIPFASRPGLSLKDRLSLIERRIIEIEIKRFDGNKSKAAKGMGISREALRKKLLYSQGVLARLEQGDTLYPDPQKVA